MLVITFHAKHGNELEDNPSEGGSYVALAGRKASVCMDFYGVVLRTTVLAIQHSFGVMNSDAD